MILQIQLLLVFKLVLNWWLLEFHVFVVFGQVEFVSEARCELNLFELFYLRLKMGLRVVLVFIWLSMVIRRKVHN